MIFNKDHFPLSEKSVQNLDRNEPAVTIVQEPGSNVIHDDRHLAVHEPARSSNYVGDIFTAQEPSNNVAVQKSSQDLYKTGEYETTQEPSQKVYEVNKHVAAKNPSRDLYEADDNVATQEYQNANSEQHAHCANDYLRDQETSRSSFYVDKKSAAQRPEQNLQSEKDRTSSVPFNFNKPFGSKNCFKLNYQQPLGLNSPRILVAGLEDMGVKYLIMSALVCLCLGQADYGILTLILTSLTGKL